LDALPRVFYFSYPNAVIAIDDDDFSSCDQPIAQQKIDGFLHLPIQFHDGS
jgi:hypothetical protein